MSIPRKPCPLEPTRGKFLSAIGHVFSAKNAELEHSSRRKLWREFLAESAPYRFRAEINVILLHFVVHFHAYGLHFDVAKRPFGFATEIRNRLCLHQDYAYQHRGGWSSAG